MAGSSLLNLIAFRKVCGEHAFEHIALCSTFWDLVDETTGKTREDELCETEDFWGGMKAKGLRVQDYAQSQDILLSMAKKRTVTLTMQSELVDKQIALEDTAAGKTVNAEKAKLKARYEADIAQAQAEKEQQLHQREEENKRRLEEEVAKQKVLEDIKKAQKEKQERQARRRMEAKEEELRQEQARKKQAEEDARRAELRRRQEAARLAAEREKREAEARAQKARDEQARQRVSQTVRNTFKSQVEQLHQAQRLGRVRAKLFTTDEQIPGFFKLCDKCFVMIGPASHRCKSKAWVSIAVACFEDR